MNTAMLFRRAALLQVLLALAAFAVADRNAWFLVAGGLLTVASSYITEGPRGRNLPSWLVGAGAILAVAWGAFNFMEQPDARVVGGIVGSVALAILMLKLYGRKGPSDWRQILALTVVIVVDAALNSLDLLAGMLVVAYAGTALAAAMLYQMYAGARVAEGERRAVTGAALGSFSAPAPSGTGCMRHLRRILVFSCVAGLLMSAIVFVLFPRESALGGRGRSGRQSGFSAELLLLGGDRLSLSAREVFSVRMLDPQGQPSQFAGPLHLRGAVLDMYSTSDSCWTTSARRARQFNSTFGTAAGGAFTPFAPEALEERANVWTQVVEMRSLATNYIFSMWLPIAIASPEERTFSINAQNAVIEDRSDERGGRPWRYSLRVQPFPGQRVVRAICPAGGADSEIFFPVPSMVKEANDLLANAGLDGLPTAAEAAKDPSVRYERNRRIARWFTEYLTGGTFRYTTDLSRFRTVDGEDPNVLFLTRYKFGHCEFFASCLAALCRSVGVEARVVTGFLATEYDSSSEEYVVRESNAHAWVEVRTAQWQWATFDPSPTGELLAAQNANRSWLDQFRWVLDPLEFAWQSRVVSFDSGAQAELAERVGGGMRGAVRAVGDWAGGVAERVNRAFRLGPAGYIWLGLVALVGIIAVAAFIVVARRDWVVREQLGAAGTRTAHRARLGRDAGFYLDALKALHRHGLPKPRWRTPLAHAQALEESAGEQVGVAFAAIVEQFYAVRYAGRHPGRTERARHAALLANLRAALARGYTRAASARTE